MNNYISETLIVIDKIFHPKEHLSISVFSSHLYKMSKTYNNLHNKRHRKNLKWE